MNKTRRLIAVALVLLLLLSLCGCMAEEPTPADQGGNGTTTAAPTQTETTAPSASATTATDAQPTTAETTAVSDTVTTQGTTVVLPTDWKVSSVELKEESAFPDGAQIEFLASKEYDEMPRLNNNCVLSDAALASSESVFRALPWTSRWGRGFEDALDRFPELSNYNEQFFDNKVVLVVQHDLTSWQSLGAVIEVNRKENTLYVLYTVRDTRDENYEYTADMTFSRVLLEINPEDLDGIQDVVLYYVVKKK